MQLLWVVGGCSAMMIRHLVVASRYTSRIFRVSSVSRHSAWGSSVRWVATRGGANEPSANDDIAKSFFQHTNRSSAAASINDSTTNSEELEGLQAKSQKDDDDDKRIFLKNPAHGFRTVPFTWSELQQICSGPDSDLSKLSRSVSQQYEYELYRRELLQTWKSIYDHILCSKFSFEERQDATTGLKFAFPSLSEVQSNPELHDDDSKAMMVVVPNDFPYFVQDDVEHWVLWKLGGKCTKEDITNAKRIIVWQHPDNPSVLDFIHWTNPPHLKSVPGIDHVHILCLLDDADGN